MKNYKLKNFLTSIYGFSFFNSLIFLYPVYALFMANSGVSDAGISLLFIIWTIGCIAAYFPVSFLANKFSPKNIILFGQIMKIAAFLLWFLCPTFWGFAIGFLLWGIQCATYDIAFESLVYDELGALRQKRIYTKINGRKCAIDTIGMVISTVGSLMLAWGYNVIAGASIAALVVSVFFILRLNVSSKPMKTKIPSVKKTLRASINLLKKSPYVLSIMILVSALTSFMYIDDYLGLIGTEMGVPENFVGGIFVLAFICQSLGSAVSYKLEHLKEKTLYMGVISLGLMFFAISLFFTVPALALFGLFYLVLGVVRNLAFLNFQHRISSSCRTFVLSIKSTVEQLFSILVYAIIGLGTVLGGYRYGILFMGAFICALGAWALLFIPTNTKKLDNCD